MGSYRCIELKKSTPPSTILVMRLLENCWLKCPEKGRPWQLPRSPFQFSRQTADGVFFFMFQFETLEVQVDPNFKRNKHLKLERV